VCSTLFTLSSEADSVAVWVARWPGGHSSVISSKEEHRALNPGVGMSGFPWRTGVYANAERPLSKGGGCEFKSRRAYSMPARLTAGRRILAPAIVVRIHGGQPRRRARLAAPLSYSGRPGSTPGGGSHALVPQSGRRAWLRAMLLRVRVPPNVLVPGSNDRAVPVRPASRG
jgi:hypothetical protein